MTDYNWRSPMTRRAVLASMPALPLSACSQFFPYKIRFALKLAIEWEGKLREAASVYELNWRKTDFLSQYPFQVRAKAEAPIIQLSQNEFAFCLLGPVSTKDEASKNMFWLYLTPQYFLPLVIKTDNPQERFDRYASGELFDKLAGFKGVYNFGETSSPVLVRFRNTRDETSVEYFPDPETPASSIVRTATLSVTTQPVTNHILEILPWLQESRGLLSHKWDRIGGRYTDRPLAGRMNRNALRIDDTG